jgi:hypothetical protein
MTVHYDRSKIAHYGLNISELPNMLFAGIGKQGVFWKEKNVI